MIRPLALLGLLAFAVAPAVAQEIVPAQPAPSSIVVDPNAVIDNSSRQANLLTGFYATKATIELCAVVIDPAILAGMDADQLRLEAGLGLDAATALKAYERVKADVVKTEPDCTEGSPDRLGIDAVTAIYTATPAATAAPAVPAQ
jgi:hypothetical protein